MEIAAVRSRDYRDLNADIEQGHLSSSICHLANIACAIGRTLQFDPATERFLGDEEACRMMTRDYRKPYVVPNEV